MSLATYRKKRRFDRTPEPAREAAAGVGLLRFVVQKHAATRLHYDFRLEADGVLKSWAIPKGPSLNPADKRLAVMVEDHPLDYRTFEGVIPEGNYGAGEVIVWDEGTYEAPGAPGRRQTEAAMADGLGKGRLSIVLHGQKLRGEFALAKLQRGGKNQWLLIKKRDAFASTADVTAEDKSALSGRTLADVRRGKKRPPARRAKKPAKRSQGAPGLMPHDVRPMLATLVDEPFDRAGWLFEPKWDGYRAVAEVKSDAVRLYSRNHKGFENKFTAIVESLRSLGHEAVLDGEIVALDDSGRSRFQLLQNYQKTGKGALIYYVFDLLYLDGTDLRDKPLHQRKKLLGEALGDLAHVRLGEHVERRGLAFFRAAAEKGLEGIIAKDSASPYREGIRGGEWLKVKTRHRQEAVIGGFTEPRGSRTGLGALVLGVYDGDDLVYIGHTGGGLDTAGLGDIRARLDPLVRRRCPFHKEPATNAPVHWVEPRLVCEVEFQEWTDDGRMRMPIFLGMRDDKAASEVRRELPVAAEAPRHMKRPRPTAARIRTGDKDEQAGAASAEGPRLTNLDKVYWPAEGYTKGDLIAYYREVSPVLLPHLHDRPLSLHRHPNGIDGQSFIQKDVGRRPPPSWVSTASVQPESGAAPITYVVCQDEATLLYLANLGCIELNPWLSRTGSLDRPDYLVIDLDPNDIPFDRAVEAALTVHRQLEAAGTPSYCKTSGKRGLHVCVPLGATYEYEVARRFAEVVANVVHEQLPDATSVVRQPALRRRKVYLDFLQNRIGQTLAAPYSARPWPGATVSTPLRWAEVRRGLDPRRFTIRTMPERLNRFGDLWAPLLTEAANLRDCLARLERGRGGRAERTAHGSRRRPGAR
ncbi:MAG TPA: DNA ligase D [Gemmataceae bacterium]|nr:DNA ligase D [Gemmataceae bacterium]